MFCVEGESEVELAETGATFYIYPGVVYALDHHERHILRAKDGEAMWQQKADGRGFDVNQLRRVRAKVGMVFQQFNLFPHLTVLGILTAAPIHVQGMERAAAEQRAMEYLEMVELSDKAQVYPGQLSGGQKQRIAIARALAMRPKIMLFDEITSALDPELAGGVLAILRKLSARRTMTMLIVTHQMEFAERSADRVLFFDQGHVVEDGEAKAVFKAPAQERTKRFLEAVLEPQA
ncbi:MAG: ATP-binding cassette domain-containing protein [Burkholderiaceae bacterium]|nr:ATP-binding cassette domain-containing protein [Burkholderiaceae bacterium]